MKIRIIATAMLAATVIFTACKDDESTPEPRGTMEEYLAENDVSEFTLSNTGLYTRTDITGEGEEISGDDVIYFYVKIHSMNGDLLYDGFKDSLQWVTSLNDYAIAVPGILEALREMNLGDKVTMLTPSELGWGQYGVDGVVRQNEDLIIELAAGEFKYSIEQFVADNDVTSAQSTSEGLYYTIEGEGEGDFPADGQSVTVHYTGYLMDSTKFDSSIDRGTPFTFVIGQESVIEGWEKGLTFYKKGQKGTLFVPYEMGYGLNSTGEINAYDDLMFDIEVIDVR
ncbi:MULTISPECIES: FKBP-type peptidyl-prolyl cis-trans isomerase [Reichenbachiella]|uniref:FKBP-type peptidyl-prolyl cis-trans isomerase n=1 Tax=Reichenbachiella TaxID=156993 RepID=UPI000E6B91CC|nr:MULTISPECIES: FKBP-type peptidyl-prolyl cis-trans isomerase [Reichenbachiella]MBU2915294.1 FKBP-type peptidyl-prolyl cis-trans isomerase [Reichenbachiella agariperforans]RJE70952.1 hypothetical protein BGP76_09240 [Reichenbachiella sp. MSK19-1]